MLRDRLCDVVSKTEAARLTWLRLLMSYGQETTMHGVRYITEPNSVLCRRSIRQKLVHIALDIFSSLTHSFIY